MGPDPGRQHVLLAGAEHGGTESGPQARWFSVCSGSSRPLSTMSCSSEKRRPLDICMKPRRFCCPLLGGGARLKAMRAAQPSPGLRFKPCAQVVRAWGGQIYDRQAGPGNSRPD